MANPDRRFQDDYRRDNEGSDYGRGSSGSGDDWRGRDDYRRGRDAGSRDDSFGGSSWSRGRSADDWRSDSHRGSDFNRYGDNRYGDNRYGDDASSYNRPDFDRGNQRYGANRYADNDRFGGGFGSGWTNDRSTGWGDGGRSLGWARNDDRSGYRSYGSDYGSSSYEGDNNRTRGGERPFMDRASDEISSWFGDREAERRREQDQHRGRGPKNYARSADRIREDVNDRLTDDARVDASHIEVTVSGTEVTLTGTVSSRDQRRRAEDVAETVSGVSHVQNNLRVADQTQTGSGEIGGINRAGTGTTSTATTGYGSSAASGTSTGTTRS